MNDKQTAWAQIAITALFIVGYFLVLFMFMAGIVRVPSDFRDAFQAILGVITASVVQILGYWFARQRTSQPPTGAS